MKKRRLCIADIHGGYKALKQVFEMAKVDYQNDKLICLGDTCDAWPQIKECFQELFKFKELVYIIGNHDEWARHYYTTGQELLGWYKQGGKATLEAFDDKMPDDILFLLNNAPAYHIEDNMVFVHGGFDTSYPIEEQDRDSLMWDRNMIYKANHKMAMHQKHGHPAKISQYDKIFVGHTPTLIYHHTEPIVNCELYMIDTGASYDGPLTLIDVDTDEYWQSDPVNSFYPGIESRGHER